MSATPPSSNNTLLGHLYDAIAAPGGFDGFIALFCEVFTLKSATLMIRNADTQEMTGLWIHGLDVKWVQSYALDFAREDILAHHMLAQPIASFYASNLDLPHPESFADSRFFREWVRPQGVAYAAGGIVLREGAWMTQMIMQRSSAQPPFNRAEMDELNELIPHLRRAIQMRQRFAELQFGQNFLAGSLDVLAMPTLLFDENSRVIHINRSATALLDRRNGLWLDDKYLLTRDAHVTRSLNLKLSNAIRSGRAGDGEPTGVVLLPRTARMPLMLMIVPMSPSGASAREAALLFVFDPETVPAVTHDLVRKLFGLTEAEVALAIALCSGKTLDDAATERGTSVHTARSQLKSIFGKTGTRRQAELVSLLVASPAYFLAQAPVQPSGAPDSRRSGRIA